MKWVVRSTIVVSVPHFRRETNWRFVATQKSPADQNASESQECFVDVGSFLVTNAQAAEPVQPGESPFHYPRPSAQSTAVIGVTHHEQRHNAAFTQTLPDCFRVITTIA